MGPPSLTWTQVASPTTQPLYDVWGSAANDVWAVGFDGTIIHWDGERWSAVQGGDHFLFRAIWGTSRTNVWAVGSDSLAAGRGRIYHFDGQSWKRFASPVETRPAAFLMDVWGTSASNVWAVGGPSGSIFHFDGTAWSEKSAPPFTNAESIWGSADHDAWIVGPHTMLRYDAGDWRTYEGEVAGNVQLTTGWGQGPTNHWAGSVIGHILRFDGLRWARHSAPEVEAAGRIVRLWGAGAWIWGVTRGGTFGPGAVVQFDGASWRVVHRHASSLYGVWGVSPSDIWAVGEAGAILHGVARR